MALVDAVTDRKGGYESKGDKGDHLKALPELKSLAVQPGY